MSKEQKNYLNKIKKEKLFIVFIQIFITILFFITWQILADKRIINPFIFSSPKKILETFVSLYTNYNLVSHILTTLYETTIAFILGISLGFIIAVILYEFKDKYPKSLSGGMKQRVALIRTLALKPNLLLLDEPFNALDYQSRLAVSNDVYEIIKKEKQTAIIVTHDLAEAICMADRIYVLSKRPCKIKKMYEVKLENKQDPINNRKDKKFNDYYDKIWKDLDVNV